MEKTYTSEKINDIDLKDIFDCGQCFRWFMNEDGSYTGTAMGRKVRVNLIKDNEDEKSGRLSVFPCTEEEFQEIWRPYFDLDRDYSSIKKTLSADDEMMTKAAAYGGGIRILRQDTWETIVDFIISQNNNIPRIKGSIENLCRLFGEKLDDPIGGDRPGAYDIPTPEKLASLTIEDLAPVRLGYRAKYLIKTGRYVAEHGIPQTYDELLALEGVGPKVANCIALFGLAKYDSFPIDVWVRKVMHALYGLDENDRKAMAAFAEDKFGELGGFAQQYLFYYMRETNDE